MASNHVKAFQALRVIQADANPHGQKMFDRFCICRSADGSQRLPGHVVLVLAGVLVPVLECSCLRARGRVVECW